MRPLTRLVFAAAVASVLLGSAVDAKKKKKEDPELERTTEKCDGCEFSLSLSLSLFRVSPSRALFLGRAGGGT